MATFQERLDDCFSKGTTKAQGDAFELLVQEYYEKDPKWEHIKEVWLWLEWPDQPQYGRDMGVDLVLQDRNGGLIAVQAKAYGDDSKVDRPDVLSFHDFAQNNLHIPTKHLVTSGSIAKTAQVVIDREHIIVVDRKQLESADIEWAETSGTKKGREAARLAEEARIIASVEAARLAEEAQVRQALKDAERIERHGPSTPQERRKWEETRKIKLNEQRRRENRAYINSPEFQERQLERRQEKQREEEKAKVAQEKYDRSLVGRLLKSATNFRFLHQFIKLWKRIPKPVRKGLRITERTLTFLPSALFYMNVGAAKHGIMALLLSLWLSLGVVILVVTPWIYILIWLTG